MAREDWCGVHTRVRAPLYSGHQCAAALLLKGVPFETRPVHLLRDGGQQHSAEYIAINPLQTIPTLRIDGHTLTQSVRVLC